MSSPNAPPRFLAGLLIVQGARRGFWPLQIVGLLDTMAYWAMAGVMLVSLTEDFGFSDVAAGHLYSISVVATTISFFIGGSIVDALGIRRSLLSGYVGSTVSRGAIFLLGFMPASDLRLAAIVAALVLMGPCVATLQTIYSIASQVFAGRELRSAGFNITYVGLNIGAVGAGLMIDLFYLRLGMPRFYILGAGAALAILCLIFTAYGIPKQQEEAAQGPASQRLSLAHLRELAFRAIRESTFWRLIAFMILLTPVRAVLIYYTILAPQYWLRMIGADAKIGLYEALNPLLVVVGTLLFIPYLAKANVYRAIACGALISAGSLLFLAMPVFDPSLISRDTQMWSYLFVVMLTIGEVTWAPRLWEYTVGVAPKGLEATYMGIAGLPLGFSKMAIAFASGYMLQLWCPPGVSELLRTQALSYWYSPPAMWLLLGSIAVFSALALFFLRRWITAGTVFAPASRST